MSTSGVSGIHWRKSSHSGHQGGECVEVGQWRKSSHSAQHGGECVEVADMTSAIMVRDSKNPNGSRLALTSAAWQMFTNNVKAGRLDAGG
ncbi:DUF397 domain-containing protein [Actinomadura sp. NEAU-AAG7]|uniref:DUF397 domain-containing protein n=1 Tax=Actinomadura sp. NEAU-AAG7 TaxID=2839640 RepID=UPI001BE3F091|nr:DUF397 domain-containing protein [Actinomadura sp. NEAU-AAG7]MBT2210548.1 DUF397 domain-containing protein [Actinomadura sp. NEAU-AAG7]